MTHKNYSLVLSRKGKSTKAEKRRSWDKKPCVFILSHYLFVVVQLPSCVWHWAPWTATRQASLSFTIALSLLKLMSIESVMPSNHLTLCHSLLFLPSVFPSIRVFSSESATCGQGTGASASASVLPLDIHWPPGWFPLGLTGLIQWMLASGRCTHCWSLAWRILNITLLVCEMSTIVW